jgi:hypothetical protein
VRDHASSVPMAKSKFDPYNSDNNNAPPPTPVGPKPLVKHSQVYGPPPSRNGSVGDEAEQLPPPPPPAPRATRPAGPVRSSPASSSYRPSFTPPLRSAVREQEEQEEEAESDAQIDWSNLSREDKAVFFSWLDEFFARYLRNSSTPSSVKASAGGPPVRKELLLFYV